MELTEINQNTQARDLNARLHRYNTQLCCTRSVSLWRMSYWRIFLSGFIYFRYYYCKARGVESVNLTIKIKLSLCFLFNRAQRYEGVLGSGSIPPLILWPWLCDINCPLIHTSYVHIPSWILCFRVLVTIVPFFETRDHILRPHKTSEKDIILCYLSMFRK